MKILVVEDDPVTAAMLRRGLEREQFEVTVLADGAEAARETAEGRYGLIILDVMLPGMDGWSLCQLLRERRDTTPILMLTARDAIEDRVRGLEAGADDYLPKPFALEELSARVRALLRRDKLHRTRVLRVADLEMDTTARTVTRAGRAIPLTPREYSLLEALMANEGRVLTPEAILERVWNDEESFSNTVAAHIVHLRKKIDGGSEAKLIRTVHGVGYTLRAPDEEPA